PLLQVVPALHGLFAALAGALQLLVKHCLPREVPFGKPALSCHGAEPLPRQGSRASSRRASRSLSAVHSTRASSYAQSRSLMRSCALSADAASRRKTNTKRFTMHSGRIF